MSRPRRRRLERGALLFLTIFAGNAALASVGYAQAFRVSGVSVVWPPSGFMLAILVLLGRRDWPLAIAAGLLSNVAVDFLEEASLITALAGSAANALEVTAAAWLLTRLAGTPVTLTTLRNVAAFVGGSAIASNAVTALAGALVLYYGWGMPFSRGWFVWWVGDGLGMLIIAPAVLVAHAIARRRMRLEWKSTAEATALLMGLVVLAHFLLSHPSNAGHSFRLDPYTLLPLLFWIAVRTGPPGSAAATIVVSIITLWNAAQGRSPFIAAGSPVDSTVLQIYAYLTVLTLSSLFATALMHERKAAETQVLDQARRATFSADVATAFAGSGQLHEILQRCVTEIARHLQATQVRIWTLSDDGSMLQPQARSGPPARDGDANVPVGEFVVGRTARRATPFISTTSDAPDVPFWPGQTPADTGGGFAAYPLLLDGRARGVLAVITSRPIQPWMADGLSSVADRIANGIARKRLEESRNQLAAILDAATDFVTIGAPEGPPVYLNPAIRTALGLGDTGQIASLFELRPAGFRQVLEATVMPALLREGSWTGETEYVARDGTRIPVSQTSVAHRAPNGRLEFISTISRDIRARRRMEDALRQSQKMEAVGQLAGGIAHDFNNILTAILGYAEVLVTDPLPNEAQRTAALEIRDAGLRAASLTRQLLAFGRQQVLQPRVTRLSSVVGELLPMLRRLVGEHIDIRHDQNEADEPIFADVTQLEQIVLNLTINAGDAMSDGGAVVLRTGTVNLEEPVDAAHLQIAPGRYAFLEVRDTGEGMDDETRSRIFEPFFTTKPMGRGTGLGLSTVYGIVKQMQGGIWVYSEPGRGTTFRIYLPRHTRNQAGEPEQPATAPPPVVGGTETLLLVEDEPGVRIFARRMLERYGYRVLVAANPSEALAACSDPALEIDLVLSDVRMPGGTGPELVETLRQKRPAMRALFMSGYSNLPYAIAGEPSDKRYFLAKPFAGAELAAKVRAILDEEP